MGSDARTLDDHQAGFEPWIGLLDLQNLILEAIANILGNRRAIDLGSDHDKSIVGVDTAS